MKTLEQWHESIQAPGGSAPGFRVQMIMTILPDDYHPALHITWETLFQPQYNCVDYGYHQSCLFNFT
ncbi:MAG: hypothetical protein WCY93_04910 [Anaerolineaceae bacterium]